MKKLITRLMSVSLLSMLFIANPGQKASAQDVTVSYQAFYDNLAPYGQWVADPEYGNVWVPNEDGDFRPYGSRGHWVMTDYGNTWVSEDPWGWACYHYGRWTYNPYYGWVWIPGYEWAPAWVSWRYGGGYSGWAPLGPGVSVGVGYNCPDSWWIFVGPQYMYERDCYSHWRGPSYNTTYIHQTTIINNYYVDNGSHVRYNYGPRAEVIQRDTHQPVQIYRVSQLNRPGAPTVGRNTVNLYRPAINRSSVSEARPNNVIQAPRSVGRPQTAPAVVSGNRQPAFRQDVQRQPGNNGVVGPRNATPNAAPNQRPSDRFDNRNNQVQPPVRNNNQPQPSRNNNQPAERPQPSRFDQPNNQLPRNNQPNERPQPAPQPRQAPQPRPQQQAPQPQPRPQQQAPQPQPRPQQQAPQPQRQQPAPQQHSEPRQAPQPQGQHEERGGRR